MRLTRHADGPANGRSVVPEELSARIVTMAALMLAPRSEPRSRRSRADSARRAGCLRYRRSPPLGAGTFHAAKSADQAPAVRVRAPESLSGRQSLAAACNQEPTGSMRRSVDFQMAAGGPLGRAPKRRRGRPQGAGGWPTRWSAARPWTGWSSRPSSSSPPPVDPRGESDSGASNARAGRKVSQNADRFLTHPGSSEGM